MVLVRGFMHLWRLTMLQMLHCATSVEVIADFVSWYRNRQASGIPSERHSELIFYKNR